MSCLRGDRRSGVELRCLRGDRRSGVVLERGGVDLERLTGDCSGLDSSLSEDCSAGS